MKPRYIAAVRTVNREINSAIQALEDERAVRNADAIVASYGGDISHVRTYGPWRAVARSWEVKFRRLQAEYEEMLRRADAQKASDDDRPF